MGGRELEALAPDSPWFWDFVDRPLARLFVRDATFHFLNLDHVQHFITSIPPQRFNAIRSMYIDFLTDLGSPGTLGDHFYATRAGEIELDNWEKKFLHLASMRNLKSMYRAWDFYGRHVLLSGSTPSREDFRSNE